MMFELTDTERGRFEDLLYELRYAGYQVDVLYSRKDVTVSATRKDGGGRATVEVQFTRPGRKLYVDGRIVQPNGNTISVSRITPVIAHVRAADRLQRKVADQW